MIDRSPTFFPTSGGQNGRLFRPIAGCLQEKTSYVGEVRHRVSMEFRVQS